MLNQESLKYIDPFQDYGDLNTCLGQQMCPTSTAEIKQRTGAPLTTATATIHARERGVNVIVTRRCRSAELCRLTITVFFAADVYSSRALQCIIPRVISTASREFLRAARHENKARTHDPLVRMARPRRASLRGHSALRALNARYVSFFTTHGSLSRIVRLSGRMTS